MEKGAFFMLCLFTKKKLDKKKNKHIIFSRSLISHLEHGG